MKRQRTKTRMPGLQGKSRRYACFSVLLLSTALYGDALAQTVTDVELRAAYCLGVATGQYEENKRSADREPMAQLKKVHLDIAAIIDERRLRFRDYLTAKGFLSGRETSAMRLALARGPKDAETCSRENELPFYKECGETCRRTWSQNHWQATNCVAKCPRPEACTRVKKCLENFLPF